jgi:replication initiation protein RepC
MVHGIAPDELIRLAPKLKDYLRRPDPTWPDIIDAADWLRHDLDISKSLWGEACNKMGRELAAEALAIISTKALGTEPGQIHGSPGGYFRGMIAKHLTGELNLDRTIWALRRAIEPHRYPANGHKSSRQTEQRL